MLEQNIQYKEDEITFKDLINKIKSLSNEVMINYKIVILFTLPIMAYFFYSHYNTNPIYNAETKFLVEGSSNSGGLGGLLGQFGIRNASKFNPYKVIEVSKSKSLIKKVLFSKYENDYLINQIISVYKLDENWAKNKPEWKGFRFKSDDMSKFSLMENQAFLNVYTKIVGGRNAKSALLKFNFDEDTGIFRYSVSTEAEKVTLELIENSYKQLKYFFEEEMVANQLNTTVILKQKGDSIQNLISRKTLQLAAQQDRTLGLVVNGPAVKKTILEKEIQALTLAYAEILKSYEMADINLKDTRPMFLKLDETYAPIEAEESSLILNLIKSFLIGALLSIIFIIGRKFYREAMI